ncbi:hypothetical protein K2173_020092 [Erythroxylum novogranatense]|uniref:Galectin domain-containing protein n=1 Tax=Erythroxylum novogranatense TaxID=1862640 RepID=A0AAV8U9W4_9ROSI|nr:hypothetical protein K2173_020092 [Erythroxylum novogranatense]
MKKWIGSVLTMSLIMLLVLRDSVRRRSIGKSILPSPISINQSDPLEWIQVQAPPAVRSSEPETQVISAHSLLSNLFVGMNFSDEVQSSFQAWNRMKHIVNYSQGLPNAMEAIREAQVAWKSLRDFLENAKQDSSNGSSMQDEQCPQFLNEMSTTSSDDDGYKLRIPCGLIQGSAITIIGIPNGLLGSFRIDLVGESVPEVLEPPIILHYNVRILGDKVTEYPVIVQNTWTPTHDWGEEERCPPPVLENNKKVDGLYQCNKMVGKDRSHKQTASISPNTSEPKSTYGDRSKSSKIFPFKKGYISVMTLRVGEEGIQMTVDGKHITSFAYRQSLEPWLVTELRISGDLKLVSVLASGLPSSSASSDELEHTNDLEALRSAHLRLHQPLDLFVGVFSTANNFKRRMAVRRTWMQYPAVKEGAVAVRFFVGLHKNQIVNQQLLAEMQRHGDIQLMPFVDYYNLITWKTIAICIFGAEVVSAKYVMKTDDDAYVRVDEVVSSLNRTNVRQGLLYGLINFDARPQRDTNSKWYISFQEWPYVTYPPWAHGPGYVVSHDIAKAVYNRHKNGNLKVFKLEDVAMGLWIEDMKKEGMEVSYVYEERVYNEGCNDGYVVAHYQKPREMLCLWKKMQELNQPLCC